MHVTITSNVRAGPVGRGALAASKAVIVSIRLSARLRVLSLGIHLAWRCQWRLHSASEAGTGSMRHSKERDRRLIGSGH